MSEFCRRHPDVRMEEWGPMGAQCPECYQERKEAERREEEEADTLLPPRRPPASRWITAVPAYGRDYENAEGAFADWVAGKDFRLCDISMGPNDGRYCSRRDFERGSLAGATIKVRYKRLENIVLLRWLEEINNWVIVGRVDEDNL